MDTEIREALHSLGHTIRGAKGPVFTDADYGRVQGLFAAVMVSSYKVRIGPFVPAFGITCSVTGSTVAYYRQQGCDTLFEIRKIF